MSPFELADFRPGIIRLTTLAISLSTIDTRRLLRPKIDVDYHSTASMPLVHLSHLPVFDFDPSSNNTPIRYTRSEQNETFEFTQDVEVNRFSYRSIGVIYIYDVQFIVTISFILYIRRVVRDIYLENPNVFEFRNYYYLIGYFNRNYYYISSVEKLIKISNPLLQPITLLLFLG